MVFARLAAYLQLGICALTNASNGRQSDMLAADILIVASKISN